MLGRILFVASFLLSIFLGLAPVGCANSPYRQVMREMNQPASQRLAARIAEVSKQHQQAMDQFEATGRVLEDLAAAQSPPTEWEAYRCLDAIELCDLWLFNLERATRSIEDLSPQAAVGPASALSESRGVDSGGVIADENAALYRGVITDFDLVRQMMQSVSVQYSAIAQSIIAPSAAERPSRPSVLPDLSSLREVLAGAVQHAAAVQNTPLDAHRADADNGNAVVPTKR